MRYVTQEDDLYHYLVKYIRGTSSLIAEKNLWLNGNRMSYLLVPVDFVPASTAALRYSLHFADAIGKEIIMLHIMYPEFEMLDLPVVSLQTTREKIEAAREKLQHLVDEALMQIQIDHDLETVPILRADIEIGTPGPVISSLAQGDDIDLIIMGMRDKHSALEKWLGSVTQHVAARAMKPLLVLPQEITFSTPKRILYASDYVQGDREAIEWIHKQWKSFTPSIDLLHIHSENKNIEAGHYQEQLNHLDTLKREFPNVRVIDHSASDAVSGLLEYTESNNYDLIALYSPRRHWWERLTHQSVSKKVIQVANMPVLILK